MATLASRLSDAVGGRTAKALETGLGLRTVEDLVRHYPRRYLDVGELTDLSALRPGEGVLVRARVVGTTGVRLRPKQPGGKALHKVDVTLTDGTSRLVVAFFNQPWRERALVPGQELVLSGTVGTFRGRPQLSHPLVLDDEDAEAAAGGLLPVYPATKALPTWTVWRTVRHVLDVLDEPPESLPAAVRLRHGLPGLGEALRLVHRPTDRAEVTRAHRRLRHDEAFVLQTALALRRRRARALTATPRPARGDGLLAAFDARLPFALTDGQRQVGAEIEADLAADTPMHRLLQGEVGSGKTVVALRAMLAVVDAGGQCALLAPTEVLAQQHHRSLSALLGPLADRGMLGSAEAATRVALVTGSLPAAARRAALLEAASGDAGVVVGTHALLEESVDFADLGLVVVDEQHRFGVEQRDALRAKGRVPPHVLVMTATPIPRTVAMTVFGDLEVSTLRELPGGRARTTTHVVPADNLRFLERTWERVREEVAAGRSAYVVCPRIGGTGAEEEPGGGGDAAAPGGAGEQDAPAEAPGPRRPPVAVLDVAAALREGPLADLRVEVLHGRLPAEEKEALMARFAGGEVDVLVATTVVEVGVDVASATVMVVMDADRFGVSQLHQLRGRVGRGGLPGLCLLVTDAPEGSPARERLTAVAATADGFALAQVDLEQRREGDVLGATQSGRRSSLRLLSVLRDEEVIRAAREEATALVTADPALRTLPGLRDAVAPLLADQRADYLEKA